MFKDFVGLAISSFQSDGVDKKEIALIAKQLFDFFDKDHNDTLDFGEIFVGLTLLFGGSADEKVRIAFDLYDVSGDQLLQFNELSHYFSCTFKVILHQNEIGGAKSCPEKMAYATALSCFGEYGLDAERDGIDFQMFKHWYRS